MKEIFIYSTLDAWIEDRPDTSIKGDVVSKDRCYIEIMTDNGFTQMINLSQLFAIVY